MTGTSGFLGGHVVGKLTAAGAMVTALSRSTRTDSDCVRWLQVDLADAQAVNTAFAAAQPQVVLHLASLADGKRDLALVRPIFDAEVVSTLNVLLAATAAKVERIVLPGSLEEPEPGEPPSSPYAAAKATTRLYGAMFRQLYQLPVVMTRIFMCYGPGQPDWKLIPYAIAQLAAGSLPTINSPNRAVDWLYAGDAAEALLAAASRPGLEGRSLDIGSGKLVTIRELVETLRAIVNPAAAVSYNSTAARAFEQVRAADLATTTRLSGWQPRVSLDQGLRLTAGHWRASRDSNATS